jgi:hypothetical protein
MTISDPSSNELEMSCTTPSLMNSIEQRIEVEKNRAMIIAALRVRYFNTFPKA